MRPSSLIHILACEELHKLMLCFVFLLVFFPPPLQRRLLLREAGDGEEREERLCGQVRVGPGPQEGGGAAGDGAAVRAGTREDPLLPRRLREEERAGAHHRAVSFRPNLEHNLLFFIMMIRLRQIK